MTSLLPTPEDPPITAMLQELAGGDGTAMDRLLPMLYPELQRLARSYMRNERPGHTLQPTALVHEAYVRLVKQEQPDYRNRAHFLGVAAHVMRQVLIDHARARLAEKRGGHQVKVSLDEAMGIAPGDSSLLALDDAMRSLTERDALLGRLVEMKFFGGLTAEESAEATGLTVAEVRRHLRLGQAWLKRELDRSPQAHE